MKNRKPVNSVEFYFGWLLANIIGSIFGIVLGGLAFLLFASLMSNFVARFSQIGSLIDSVGFILAAFILSYVFGLAQWLVLRLRLESARRWILLTSLGSISSVIFIFLLSEFSGRINLPPTFFGGIIGFCLGTLQWFLLKQRVNQAGWWILISAISATASVLIKYDCHNCTVDSEVGIFADFGTYALIYVGVYAAISGIFLTAMTASFNLRNTGQALNEISNTDKSSM